MDGGAPNADRHACIGANPALALGKRAFGKDE
jgi:hypothetical protein